MVSFKSDRVFQKPYNKSSRAPQGDWLRDKASGMNINAPRTSRLFTSSEPTCRLLVSNLHYEVNAKDLTTIFGQVGTLVCEPLISYDRSGRSLGRAIVSFETTAEAVHAKKQFNGILAKGQPMSVGFIAPRAPRVRSSSAPNTPLINRVQKRPLSDRLAGDDSSVRTAQLPSTNVGPIRTRFNRLVGNSHAMHGTRKGLKKPPTAEELDKELDAFMVDSRSLNVSTEGGAATTGTSVADQDAEMA